MKTGSSLKNRQGGAVAVMVGIGMVMLIGFLALVMDLGHLYIAKTGLQNAADAAALSGAKQLDGTGAHICCGSGSAADMAIKTAGLNTFFGIGGQEKVEISDDNVWVSTVPYPETDSDGNTNWVPASSAATEASNSYFFIKVDTASRNLTTWFAPIWNIFTTSTFGMAVAGFELMDVMPLGICAIDETDTINYGFKLGVGYNVNKINEILAGLAPGTQMWLHPTATGTGENECDSSYGSTNKFEPFVCLGKSAMTTLGKKIVITNTGNQAALDLALNTRFGKEDKDFSNKLTAALCPPDANIKEFGAKDFPDNKAPSSPVDWEEECTKIKDGSCETTSDWAAFTPTYKKTGNDATGQGATLTEVGNTNTIKVDVEKSVFGSYTEPEGAFFTPSPSSLVRKRPNYPPPSPYSPYWNGLKNGGNQCTPTKQTGCVCDSGNDYCEKPGDYTGKAGRRAINLVVIDCSGNDGGVCREINALAIGKFFMPVKSDIPDYIYGEFAGMTSLPVDSGSIKLYR